MTMGDVPTEPVSRKEVEALQTKLINDYSFHHLDNSHGQNYIAVKGKLMMIDFELWENLEIKKSWTKGSQSSTGSIDPSDV